MVRGEGAALPASPPQARPAAARRLLTLTRDAALEQSLRELQGDINVVAVDSLPGLTEELMRGPGTALLDAAALDAPVEAVVDALATQFPDLCLMVAGRTADQTALASRISDQTVFRFVHKPASPQRMRLFMDAAARHGEQARNGATAAARPQPLGRPAPPRTGGVSPAVYFLLAALVLAAATAWALWPRATPPAPVASVPDTAQLARQQAEASAAQALEDALRSAETALLAGNLDEAAAAIGQARTLDPANPRIAFLSTQVEREQARLAADTAQREAEQSLQARVRGSLVRMRDRIDEGALLEPIGDSATSHYRDAFEADASDASVKDARDTLVAALLTAADRQLDSKQADAARRLVDVAAQINSGAPGLDVLRRRVDEARIRPAPATTGMAPAQQATIDGGTAVAPTAVAPTAAAPTNTAPANAVPANAAAATADTAAPPAPTPVAPAAIRQAAAPVDTIVAASTLTVLRKVEPEYPAQAYDRLISGWVELEFTVATNGSVRNVVVTASEPRRIFDTVAAVALRDFRFAPVVRDGVAVEQRARIRMRFTP